MAPQPRRWLCIFLTLLTLFLVGTVVVLSTVVAYFGVDQIDVITEHEMLLYEKLAAQALKNKPTPTPISTPSPDALTEPVFDTDTDEDLLRDDDLEERRVEPEEPYQRIPKIVHQTWMTDVLPDRWEKVRKSCQALHPDYEYILWTDASSREFIATHYSWFLTTFDSYPYPIQRADAIRYFVLHYYGGIYMDLDVGCQQRMDPFLYFHVVLPATMPVGVSNDIMMAEKGHDFMYLVIHNLITFNHQYGTNYPTVMFSTGPMMLSAQYGLWPKEDPELTRIEDRQVRILPRRWYGKNAPEGERGLAYFSHFYGSSWHADDAGFIKFLGNFGIAMMYMGLAVVLLGIGRLLWSKRSVLKKQSRLTGAIALPFHVPDPFARPGTPGTPGSRPGSPFNGSRSGTPSGHSRRPSEQVEPHARAGVLYYLPVWILPTPTSAGGSAPSSWAQYLSGGDGTDTKHPYHPIPNYSRPPSPSNNSILHAPGAIHDGAFDGVHLHSISSPSGGASSSSASGSGGPPSPPAYSTLKNWGTAFFRATTSGGGHSTTSSLPIHAPTPRVPTPSRPFASASSPTSPTSPRLPFSSANHSQHARSTSTSSASARPTPTQPRGRSPLPPQYETEGTLDQRRAGSTTPGNAGGAGGVGVGSRPSGGDAAGEGGAEEEVGGDEWEGSEGRGVEEEVDRLLSEMAPEFEASRRED